MSSCHDACTWVIVWARPFFMGRPGWVRSRAWIWLFSSNDSSHYIVSKGGSPPQRRGVPPDVIIWCPFGVGFGRFLGGRTMPKRKSVNTLSARKLAQFRSLVGPRIHAEKLEDIVV